MERLARSAFVSRNAGLVILDSLFLRRASLRAPTLLGGSALITDFATHATYALGTPCGLGGLDGLEQVRQCRLVSRDAFPQFFDQLLKIQNVPSLLGGYCCIGLARLQMREEEERIGPLPLHKGGGGRYLWGVNSSDTVRPLR